MSSELHFKDTNLPENESFRHDLNYLLKKFGYESQWAGAKELTLFEMGVGTTTSEIAVNELFSEHPTLREIAHNDATVYAWFKQAQLNRCSIEEALVGALVWVTQEKQKLFDEVIELKMKKARHD